MRRLTKGSLPRHRYCLREEVSQRQYERQYVMSRSHFACLTHTYLIDALPWSPMLVRSIDSLHAIDSLRIGLRSLHSALSARTGEGLKRVSYLTAIPFPGKMNISACALFKAVLNHTGGLPYCQIRVSLGWNLPPIHWYGGRASRMVGCRVDDCASDRQAVPWLSHSAKRHLQLAVGLGCASVRCATSTSPTFPTQAHQPLKR